MKCRKMENNNIVWFGKNINTEQTKYVYFDGETYLLNSNMSSKFITPIGNKQIYMMPTSEFLTKITPVDNLIYNVFDNNSYFYIKNGEYNFIYKFSIYNPLIDEDGNTIDNNTELTRGMKYHTTSAGETVDAFTYEKDVQYYKILFDDSEWRTGLLGTFVKGNTYLVIDQPEGAQGSWTDYIKLFILDNEDYYRLISDSKSSNYSEGKAGVADSLAQRLSVIKGELWYDINYGLPLLDENKSSITMDSYILSVLNKHPDVIAVVNFESDVVDKTYRCSFEVQTKYGNIVLEM